MILRADHLQIAVCVAGEDGKAETQKASDLAAPVTKQENFK